MDATHIGFERDKYMTQLIGADVSAGPSIIVAAFRSKNRLTFTFHRHFSTHRVVTLQMLEEEAFSGEDPDCGLR